MDCALEIVLLQLKNKINSVKSNMTPNSYHKIESSLSLQYFQSLYILLLIWLQSISLSVVNEDCHIKTGSKWLKLLNFERYFFANFFCSKLENNEKLKFWIFANFSVKSVLGLYCCTNSERSNPRVSKNTKTDCVWLIVLEK